MTTCTRVLWNHFIRLLSICPKATASMHQWWIAVATQTFVFINAKWFDAPRDPAEITTTNTSNWCPWSFVLYRELPPFWNPVPSSYCSFLSLTFWLTLQSMQSRRSESTQYSFVSSIVSTHMSNVTDCHFAITKFITVTLRLIMIERTISYNYSFNFKTYNFACQPPMKINYT